MVHQYLSDGLITIDNDNEAGENERNNYHGELLLDFINNDEDSDTFDCAMVWFLPAFHLEAIDGTIFMKQLSKIQMYLGIIHLFGT